MLDRLEIKRLFGVKDIKLPLKKTTVLVGKNGTGKSTILRIIYSMLNNDDELALETKSQDVKLFEEASLFLNEEIKSYIKSHEEDLKVVRELLEQFYVSSKLERYSVSELEELRTAIDKKLKVDENFKLPSIFSEKKIDILPIFISTIYMSANSVQNVRMSSGIISNFLDIEIERIYQDFLATCSDKKLIEELESSINRFFKESNKRILFDENERRIIVEYNGSQIRFEGLSSGEKQVIYILIKVAKSSLTNSIILMDEPEISLHLSWQEMLISEIRKVNNKSQLIIVTHSPGIIMDGWRDSFIDINEVSNFL